MADDKEEQHLRKTWPSTEFSEDRIIGEQEVGQHLVVNGTPLSKWTVLYIWPEQSMMMKDVVWRLRGCSKQEKQHGGR